ALLCVLIHAPLAAQAAAWSEAAAPRDDHAMAFDSQRGRTVLFGGFGNSGLAADTWEWNGSSWSQVATTGPPARAWHAMPYASQRRRTVLFGGGLAGLPSTRLGDTWEWDGSAWTQVATTGPAGRSACAMAFDSQRGRTVLFGGSNNGSAFNDTWEWD